MDSMEFNKIAGAILSALLIIFGGSVLVHEVSATHKVEKAGYDIAKFVTISTAPSAEPEVEDKPIFEAVKLLLASAEAGEGQKTFKACAACHSVNEGGANKIGPNLWNIVNRDIGAIDGFKYSNAMAKKEGNWGYEQLAGFLHQPKGWLQGTKMAYRGIRKPEDVANMLAYLRTLASTPAALPE
ncbi:MAG: cytochrome c family protein [Pseudomonadota bacterium]